MTRKKKPADKAPAFASRAAAEGTAVSVIVKDQEHTLEAAKGPDGWAITPTSDAEAAALAAFSDEALNPPPSSESADEGYAGMTVPQLKELLADKGLPGSGKKDELVERLEEAESEAPANAPADEEDKDADVSTGNDEAAGDGEQGGQA